MCRLSIFILIFILTVMNSAVAEPRSGESQREGQLKVVTYNHALLNFKNPLRSVYVPMRESRSKAAPKVWSEFLAQNQPDAVLLQEIWYRNDYRRLAEAFKLQGYSPVVLDHQVPKYKRRFGIRGHGLQIFLRDETLELISGDYRPFEDAQGEPIIGELENFSALYYKVRVKRGTLLAKVRLRQHAGSPEITMVTTHLTSRLEEQAVRSAQVQSLSDILADLDEGQNTLVLGADLNFSPNFERAREEDVPGYQLNAQQYSTFLDQSKMADSYRTAERVEGYEFTQDLRHNVLARRGVSTKSEPDQRLDYIFLKRAKAKMYQTVFSERSIKVRRKKFQNRIPMSDHFGVMVECRVPLATTN